MEACSSDPMLSRQRGERENDMETATKVTTEPAHLMGGITEDISDSLLSRIDDLERAASKDSRINQGQKKYIDELTLKIVDLEFLLQSARKKYHGQVTARRGLELALLREKAVNRVIPTHRQQAHREAREGIRASD